MPRTTGEPANRELSDEVIVTPHREVKLSNGKRVLVAPWGMTEGKLVLYRLDELAPKLEGTDVNARQLLARAFDEVVDLVALTINVEREEMEKPAKDGGWLFEDLLAVTEVVLDVCVIRSDGRGALPLLIKLVGKMGEMVARSAGPAIVKPRSNDSERPASSPATSGNGSGSPPRRKRARSSRTS